MKFLPIVIGASIGVAGLVAGVAFASIPSADGSIHGCYQKNVGNLRVIDPATDSCRPSEVALTWSETGPQGSQGVQGVQGPRGPIGTTGPTGPVGPAGPVGSTGLVGPAGPVGSTGPVGPAGPVGSTGPIGPAGPAGPQGIAGNLALAGQSCPPGQHVTGFNAAGEIKCETPLPATCASTTIDFSITSFTNSTPVFPLEEWPGGTQTITPAPGCSVTIRRPSGHIDIVGLLGDGWQVVGFSGYGSATGAMLPPACNSTGALDSSIAPRPSCSSALPPSVTYPGAHSQDTFRVSAN